MNDEVLVLTPPPASLLGAVVFPVINGVEHFVNQARVSCENVHTFFKQHRNLRNGILIATGAIIELGLYHSLRNFEELRWAELTLVSCLAFWSYMGKKFFNDFGYREGRLAESIRNTTYGALMTALVQIASIVLQI